MVIASVIVISLGFCACAYFQGEIWLRQMLASPLWHRMAGMVPFPGAGASKVTTPAPVTGGGHMELRGLA
jgi:hypothetical protein